MAGMSSDGGDDQPISSINMTPFVDIILVVLIIFMVTAPMIMKPSINVDLPDAASGDDTVPDKLEVTIAKEGGIFLNGQSSSLDQIKIFAETNVKQKPTLQAVIAADKDVVHGLVIQVIDVVKSAGIKKFAISIDKK